MAEELLRPAVHAGNGRLAVEVDDGGPALAGGLDLVDPAGRVALLVPVQPVLAQILLTCT